MEEILYRNADINDLDLIREMFYHFMNIQQFEPIADDEYDYTFAHLIQDKRDTCIVAEKEGNILGFLNLTYTFSTFNAAYEANVDDIYVADEYRGQGIATQLLKAAIEDANLKGACRISILVRIEDTEARALFEKLHFVKFDRLYYRKSLK